jgi:hypothetical protein
MTGYARIPEAVLYDEHLTPLDVRVYGALDRHAGADGECWPGLERLAALVHATDRGVRNAIGRLCARGHVEKVRRGRTLTNTYRVTGTNRPVTPRVTGTNRPSDRNESTPSDRNEKPPEREPKEREPENETPSSSHAYDDRLPGLDDTPRRPAPPARRPDPYRATAQEVLCQWWERQDPRPQTPYPAALKVLAKALRDGWTQAELRQALEEVPAISGAALDYWRRRRNGRGPADGRTLEERLAAGAAQLRGGRP